MKDTVYGPVSDALEIHPLKDLCVSGGIQTGPFGSQLHQKDYLPIGTPIITVEHLGENRVLHQDLPRISDADKERLSRYVMRKGDIIFSRVGSVDRRALVRDEEDGWLFSGRCLRVRPDITKIDPSYLSWFFGLEIFKDYIRRIAVGATMPSLNTELLSNIPVIIPSLSAQHTIAGILDAMDDKIELNRLMNQTLQSMARAIFKSWFIDFDPVRFHENAALATLFPKKLINSELGEIPDGWEIKSIGEIAERVGMGPFGSSIKVDTFVDRGIPVINGQQLHGFMLEDSGFNFISFEHAEKLKNSNVYPGDIVLTHRGTLGQVAIIPVNAKYKRYIVSQSQFFVRCNIEKIAPNFLLYYFQSTEGQYRLLANRSSVGVPAIAQPVTYLRSIKLVVPPKEVLDAFEKTISPMHNKYSANRRESRMLASLRDSLLPKLMLGSIRVHPQP